MGSGALTKATELFEQEAQRLEHLGSHPQIPDLLAFFEQEGRFYLIQQFINGQDLLKELNKLGKFNENQVRDLLNQLLPVLVFIHTKQVIHRDIKPENIIRNEQGILVLIDFGVSKLFSGSITTLMGTIAFTPGYAAPEQMRGMVYPASDLYSLAVTCIRLLTGCLPLLDGHDELFDPIQMEWVWRSKVKISDENLGLVLDKMLQDKVGNRFQSAAEVLAALQPNQVQTPVISTSAPSQVSSTQSLILTTTFCDYSQLDKHLAAGNWKEADVETRRAMLKVVKRENEGWLNEDSINKFPCEDLKIIDQLWQKYSNGRFGFSVQKRIWQQWGKENYETDCKLSTAVGWRVNNSWKNYNDLNFSLDAPVGHLPAVTINNNSESLNEMEKYLRRFGNLSSVPAGALGSLALRCVKCDLWCDSVYFLLNYSPKSTQ